MGHRSTEWCPRCGTSLSQHELTQSGVYQDRADPSLFVRFPLLDRDGRVRRRLDDDPVDAARERRGGGPSGRGVRAARERRMGRRQAVPGRHVRRAAAAAATWSGWRYRGPFDDLRPGSEVEHRVIPWDDVTMDQGTGIVHIAPGCGGEDFELSKVHDLAVLTPVDESGRFYDDYGWLHGLSTTEAADQIIGRLGETGFLVEAGALHPCLSALLALRHAVDLPALRRLVHLRRADPGQLLEENAKVQWVPEYMGKRMDDWLRNMGDWNISRRRYYGLPLPFYPCSCGHLTVVGSKSELRERATEGFEQLEELRRPWVDRVPIRCAACGETVTRIPEVGDVWLDAGIVPFATLGWENEEWVTEGYATGAARGLTKADLPDHEYWETLVPRRLGLGDA